jgi:hypothetical protein
MIKVLEEHAETFYADPDEDDATKGSVEEELEKELKSLNTKKKRLFIPINTGIDCCIFFKVIGLIIVRRMKG